MEEIRQRVLAHVENTHVPSISNYTKCGVPRDLIIRAFKDHPVWGVHEYEICVQIYNKIERRKKDEDLRSLRIRVLSSFISYPNDTWYEIIKGKARLNCAKKWFITSIRNTLISNVIDHIFTNYVHYVDFMEASHTISIFPHDFDRTMFIQQRFCKYDPRFSGHITLVCNDDILILRSFAIPVNIDDLFSNSISYIHTFMNQVNAGIDLTKVRNKRGETILHFWDNEKTLAPERRKTLKVLYQFLTAQRAFFIQEASIN